MKNRFLSLPLLLLCFTILSACSSEDDAVAPTKEEMLQNKRWQTTSISVSNPIFGTLDYYTSLETCQQDNYLEFKINKVVVLDEGATKCTPTAPQQMQGTWALEEDVLRISTIGVGLGLPVNELLLTVKEITPTTFTADFNQTYAGLPVTGTLKMKAK